MHTQKITGMLQRFGRFIVIDMISRSQDRTIDESNLPGLVPHPSMYYNA